jgi:hypothetical protein
MGAFPLGAAYRRPSIQYLSTGPKQDRNTWHPQARMIGCRGGSPVLDHHNFKERGLITDFSVKRRVAPPILGA